MDNPIVRSTDIIPIRSKDTQKYSLRIARTLSSSIKRQPPGPSKEWKPKLNQVSSHASGTVGTSDVVPNTVEVSSQFSAGVPEEATSKLQKKMEELQFSDDQHVIIPNHLQVPESERTGLSFGSFDANFTLGTTFINGPNENSSMATVSSQIPEENIDEHLSTQNASTTQEQDFSDNPDSPPQMQMPQNLSSGEADISSISAVPEYDQNKQEVAVAQEGPQFSVVHTAPAYSTFELVPPMLGNQFAPFESSELQACDATSIPSFVVQQPFDPSTGYYTQIYPPGGDSNGRFSPFLAPDTAAKYNGNLAILPPQTVQTAQESANSTLLSSTGPTPAVTQAVGVMQTSISVTQQPVPVFRQPAGVHISHYPPNYIPYQYFSPFYVPTPSIQHFLSNPAFLQQPLTGSVYPPPAAPATTPVKNSLLQYKTGTNSSNSNHSGMPTGYGPYGSTQTGYSLSPAVTSGNSTGNEDITGPQYKENDVYITGQQSEGSAVWVPSPGRDIPSMQTSSLYSLPSQGQHMAFTPLQAGHGAFNSIYHPSQSVAAAPVHTLLQPSQTMAGAVEMVGRPSGVYQQPQRAQINWA
ncbi:hypothetical protein Taro_011905, partial [Colocasia esculenta]|nr:hypothetical protein [Colocasia esculenta]